jgi:hypothetical protein
MTEDNKEEQLENIFTQLNEKLKPAFDDVKTAFILFIQHIQSWRNSDILERPHHLAEADKQSQIAVKKLKEIIDIAKRTENPDLITQMNFFIKDIQQLRKKLV